MVVLNHATLPFCDITEHGTETPAAVVRVEQTSATPEEYSTIEKIAKVLVTLTTKMHFGVEIFFVISGYCVTASAESLRRSGHSMREYFKRRFIRIYPPFWCVLLCSVAGCFAIDRVYPGLLQQSPWAVTVPWELSARQWLGCFTLSGTWIGYLTGESQLCFPMQSWTLCYEEQFYAVVGLLLAFSRTKFFRVATILTAGIFVIDAAALIFHLPIRGFFFDEHWFMFAAGVGVYWALNCATPRQSALFQCSLMGATIGLALLASRTSIFGAQSHCSGWRVVGALSFALLLTWLKRYDEKIAALTSLNWLKSCGIMCYSIYLVHLFPGKLFGQYMRISGHDDNLSILFICIPVALVISVALGYLFHISVERRFLISRSENNAKFGQTDVRADRSDTIPAANPPMAWTLSFEQAHRGFMNRNGADEKLVDSSRRKVA